VAFQSLQHLAGFRVPQPGSVIKTSREDLSPLGVKDSLRDLPLMTFEDGGAGEGRDVVNPHCHVYAGSDQTSSDGVEVEIQDLISMSA
jgi:hypothetical protein